jgi:hypothetical protein
MAMFYGFACEIEVVDLEVKLGIQKCAEQF